MDTRQWLRAEQCLAHWLHWPNTYSSFNPGHHFNTRWKQLRVISGPALTVCVPQCMYSVCRLPCKVGGVIVPILQMTEQALGVTCSRLHIGKRGYMMYLCSDTIAKAFSQRRWTTFMAHAGDWWRHWVVLPLEPMENHQHEGGAVLQDLVSISKSAWWKTEIEIATYSHVLDALWKVLLCCSTLCRGYIWSHSK